ncbi:MAG TPA: hypothetical protein PKO28_02435 [Bacilli bacterium]|nr:hypothetical protein [Bacilli bacterium]HPS18622.1 hypothetical protein [Bacilli bacterium]
MEKKRILVESNSRFFALLDASLFDWQLKEENARGEKIELQFIRDEKIPYYNQLAILEKRYFRISDIPMWSLYVTSALAVAFLTLYLVMSYVDPNFDQLLWLLAALLPGVIFSSGLGVLAIIRTRQSLKYSNSREERYSEYQRKVQELKDEKVRN